MRLTQYVSRLSGFALATLLTGAVGFAAIPVLIAASDARTWSAIAFGQAVGGIGMVVIGWGWNISGAAEAALMTRAQADEALLRSVAIRLGLALPVSALAAAAAFLLAPYEPALAAASAVSFGLNGLSAAWFYTGMRDPRALIRREVLPRTGGIVVGLALAAATGSVWWFPPLLAIGCLAAVALNVTGAGGSMRTLPARVRDPLPDLRRQLPALTTTLVSTAYLATPVVIVGLLAPQQLPVFAMADRLFKTANMAASPVLNVLQGSIPSLDPVVFRRRVRRGLRSVLVLGAVAGTLYALGAPLVAAVVSSGQTVLPLAVTVPFAFTLVATYVSQVVGLSCLITLGRVRAVAVSATVGAIVGLPVLVAATALAGAAGAAVGEAFAELSVSGYQLRALRAGLRESSTVPA